MAKGYRSPYLLLSILGLLALTACSGLGTVAGPDNEAPIAPSQSNLASLSEAVQKHPDDPQAYNMRGSVLADAGNAEAALADFNKAISLDPNYAQAYANRGLLRRQSGKLDLALADYNKALSIDGN
jgi:tetratricopeptide (TPR) repeat protein